MGLPPSSTHTAPTPRPCRAKDLIVLQPIDAIGKKHIGRIIIVEPDAEDEDAFLRQAVEALQQGGMRCVVVRGHGAYAVGADLTQAWSNASMVEHSMRVAMLAVKRT